MYRQANLLIAHLCGAAVAAAYVTGLFCCRPAAAQTITYTNLYSFQQQSNGNPGFNGADPEGSVVADGNGNLYGTTWAGGNYNYGVIYYLDTSHHLQILHHFTGGADGSGPIGDLMPDGNGHLYGVTQENAAESGAFGVVYRINMSPSNPQFTVLHTFSGTEGATPMAGVVLDSNGRLYGTTAYGGGYGNGTVWRIGWFRGRAIFATLYSFSGGNDGNSPQGNLYRDGSGNLFGTTAWGGAYGHGNIFELDSQNAIHDLYDFVGGADGDWPAAGLSWDGNGGFYGTTSYGGSYGYGVVFDLVPYAPGVYSLVILHAFTGGWDGSMPLGGVTTSWYGLYGTTYYGGAGQIGVVWHIDTGNNFSVVHSFDGGPGGAYPQCTLWRDTFGDLFGTCSMGGTVDGAVFEIIP